MEDNDPTGFKSKAGIAAKAKAGIVVFPIPKRSPELNVLDYAVWKEVNKRMLLQERARGKSARDTSKRTGF